MLAPTLDALVVTDTTMTVHPDRGYDSGLTCTLLTTRGLGAEIARRGCPAPITAGQRWVVERTTAWTHAHKMLVLRRYPTMVFDTIFQSQRKAGRLRQTTNDSRSVGHMGS